VEIRRLGPNDVPAMRQLNALFASVFNDLESYASAKPDDAYLHRILGREQVIVLAAVAEQEVVGGLVGYILDKLEQQRSEIYIYDLAVSESARRRGVATALIAKLGEIAREIGAWVIYVQADYEDEAAVALYSKLGSREDVMHFDIAPAVAR